MEKIDPFISDYAEALFRIARAEDSLENIEDGLLRLKKLLKESGELREFIHNPGIGSSEKKNALFEIFGKDASPIILNFLNLLIDQNKQRQLPEIIEEYLNITASFRKKITAHVISAVPLTEGLIGEMEEKLSALTGKNVAVKNEVDESIVGGFVVRIKEKVMDASIYGQFEKLKEKMRQED